MMTDKALKNLYIVVNKMKGNREANLCTDNCDFGNTVNHTISKIDF
jgi:hypothetical protein